MNTFTILSCVVLVFVLMARQKLTPEVGMPILSLIALLFAGAEGAAVALKSGFEEFGFVALMFSGVAIAAHQLRDSDLLKWMGMLAGQMIGRFARKLALPPRIGIPAVCLSMTWLLAALFHNTTSILITAEIAFIVCQLFGIRASPLLNGCLVASNLGGFSTRWGDTPNLVEAHVWGLSAADFAFIAAVNFGCMVVLIALVALLLEKPQVELADLAVIEQKFAKARRDTSIDAGLAAVAVVGLAIVIIPPIVSPTIELQCLAFGMLWLGAAGVYLGRTDDNPFDALGFSTLSTLAAVFVLAAVLGGEALGITPALKSWIQSFGAPVWAIICVSYVGTLFTEAASWAKAASVMVHQIDPSARAAWALGAGICAGSSSLLTAASAGIILMRTTERYKLSRVTFRSYLGFGLMFSLLMVGFYSLVLTLFFAHSP